LLERWDEEVGVHGGDGEGEEREEEGRARTGPVKHDESRISEGARECRPRKAHQEVKPWIG
jgi:hypothetical protein